MVCKFLESTRAGYRCGHPDIYKSAKLYEESKRIRIVKSVDYIGSPPKKCLRWCPLRMMNKTK